MEPDNKALGGKAPTVTMTAIEDDEHPIDGSSKDKEGHESVNNTESPTGKPPTKVQLASAKKDSFADNHSSSSESEPLNKVITKKRHADSGSLDSKSSRSSKGIRKSRVISSDYSSYKYSSSSGRPRQKSIPRPRTLSDEEDECTMKILVKTFNDILEAQKKAPQAEFRLRAHSNCYPPPFTKPPQIIICKKTNLSTCDPCLNDCEAPHFPSNCDYCEAPPCCCPCGCTCCECMYGKPCCGSCGCPVVKYACCGCEPLGCCCDCRPGCFNNCNFFPQKTNAQSELCGGRDSFMRGNNSPRSSTSSRRRSSRNAETTTRNAASYGSRGGRSMSDYGTGSSYSSDLSSSTSRHKS